MAQPHTSKDQFNGGSALQDELLGSEQGIYSTFYRSYDPATGRFQGVDPLADTYADSSPYAFALNDPVNLNDPDGNEPIYVNGRLINQRDVVTGQETFRGSAFDAQLYQSALTGFSNVGVTSQSNTIRDSNFADYLSNFAKWLTGTRDATYTNGQVIYGGQNYNRPLGSSEVINPQSWQSSIAVNWLTADNIPGYASNIYLANESSHTIFFKPDNDTGQYKSDKAYPLEQYNSVPFRVDGFSAPYLNPGSVFKVIDNLKVRVRDTGVTIVVPTTYSSLRIGGQQAKGGWQDVNFYFSSTLVKAMPFRARL